MAGDFAEVQTECGSDKKKNVLLVQVGEEICGLIVGPATVNMT